MSQGLPVEIERLEKAFDIMRQGAPFLKPVMDAFQEVFVSRAIIKSKLSDHLDVLVPAPDPAGFAAGHPLLMEDRLQSLVDPWGDTIEAAIQPLAKAFPAIKGELQQLRQALAEGKVKLAECIEALLKDQDNLITEKASYLGLSPVVLKFILGQIIKPFVEKKTESLRPLVKNLSWHKGYCPICGAYPELSFIQDEEGRRWLRCSLCGYSWKFDRMTCPYCEKVNKNKELIFAEESEHKWIECCTSCNRYIVGIDLRKQPEAIVDIAAISMVHLDIIAQQKRFYPIAVCAWNMVIPEDNM